MDGWTSDPVKAHDFKLTIAAIRRMTDRQLNDVEVVLMDTEHNQIVPIMDGRSPQK